MVEKRQLKPGVLVLPQCDDLPSWHHILTIDNVEVGDTGAIFSFLEKSGGPIYLFPWEVMWVADSLESVPLEDWASLAHLLHPKLKTRVHEWILGNAGTSDL